jgi:CrcB protein
LGKILAIGVGGFIGSILRYAVSGFVQTWMKSVEFPYGTLVVNVLGCLVIGLLSQLIESRGILMAEVRAFVIIGVLGGFTTFSTFSNETINLWRDSQTIWALANVGAHVILGLGAVWLGRVLAHLIWR